MTKSIVSVKDIANATVGDLQAYLQWNEPTPLKAHETWGSLSCMDRSLKDYHIKGYSLQSFLYDWTHPNKSLLLFFNNDPLTYAIRMTEHHIVRRYHISSPIENELDKLNRWNKILKNDDTKALLKNNNFYHALVYRLGVFGCHRNTQGLNRTDSLLRMIKDRMQQLKAEQGALK